MPRETPDNLKGPSSQNHPTRPTRGLILDAALELFHEQGYNKTTTKNIAQRAGVNEVTIFRQFGTKESLLHTLVERELDISDSLKGLPTVFSGDPVEDLTQVALFISGQMRPRMRISKIVLTEGALVGLEALGKKIPMEGIARLTALFERMGAADPSITAITYMSFIFRSVLLEALLGEDPMVVLDRETIERFVKVIVSGMYGNKGTISEMNGKQGNISGMNANQENVSGMYGKQGTISGEPGEGGDGECP
jgi:AcrR family transcriptional regulator